MVVIVGWLVGVKVVGRGYQALTNVTDCADRDPPKDQVITLFIKEGKFIQFLVLLQMPNLEIEPPFLNDGSWLTDKRWNELMEQASG